MVIPRYLQAEYRPLSAGGDDNSNNFDTNQVYNAMLRATTGSINVVKCRSRCDVLKSLKKEGVGTSEVEGLVKKLCVNGRKEMFKNSVVDRVKQIVMQEKINDAYSEYRKSVQEGNQIWKECKKVITGMVRGRYLERWRVYIGQVKKKMEREGQKKTEWLISKWRRKKDDVPEVYKGISIKGEDDGFPPDFNSEPRLYGGVEIDEAERAALMLPPKFGLFEEISVTKCRVQLEEALNKLRWNSIIGQEEQRQNAVFYDENTRTIDINNLRVTSLPFNPGVTMPGPMKQEEEVKIHKFKNEVMELVKEMKGKSKEWENLSEEEKEGLTSLKERVRQGEVVCCVTDKSGRWACETKESYKEACMDELRDEERTPEIDMREHDQGEREMNCHATALLRMMGLEDREGTEGERLRRAVQATGTGLAPFYGLRKDHKETGGGVVDRGVGAGGEGGGDRRVDGGVGAEDGESSSGGRRDGSGGVYGHSGGGGGNTGDSDGDREDTGVGAVAVNGAVVGEGVADDGNGVSESDEGGDAIF